MPRTVEHIVACHQHASALRRAGKPIWPHKINLKAILDEGRGKDSHEQIVAIAKQLAQELRRLPSRFFDLSHEDCDFDFVDKVEELEQMTVEITLQDRRSRQFDAFRRRLPR